MIFNLLKKGDNKNKNHQEKNDINLKLTFKIKCSAIMYKIAFITDLHIDNNSGLTLGINTQKRFEDTLQFVKRRDYQMVCLGGDLCNTVGESFIYTYVKEKMDGLDLPYHFISGNHDNSRLMATVMGGEHLLMGNELFFNIDSPYGNMYFLDSSLGSLSEAQWQWLDNHLENCKDSFVTLFMHHPPLKAFSKHMEPRYEFQEFDRFEKFTQRHNRLKFRIFTGHYHMDRTIIRDNVELFVSPSTYVQIDPDFDTFQPLLTGPLFREIVFGQKGVLSTRIINVI